MIVVIANLRVLASYPGQKENYSSDVGVSPDTTRAEALST